MTKRSMLAVFGSCGAVAIVVATLALRGYPAADGVAGSRDRVAVVDAGQRPARRAPQAEPARPPANETAPTPSATKLQALSDHVDHALTGAAADASRLHAEVVAGPHGAATEQAENRMVSAMPAAIGVALNADALQARCGGQVCELAGELASDVPSARADLTNGHWLDTLPRLGYAPGPVVVERTDGRTTFVMYVRRLP